MTSYTLSDWASYIWTGKEPPTVQQKMEKIRKELQGSVRRLGREVRTTEKDMIRKENEMRRDAKSGAKGSREQLIPAAKELARLRKRKRTTMESVARLEALCDRMKDIKTQAQIADALEQAAYLMQEANGLLGGPTGVYQMTKDFERQSLTNKELSKMIDDVLEGESGDDDELLNEDEETKQILNSILDELGTDLSSKLSEAPTPPSSKVNVPQQQAKKQQQQIQILQGKEEEEEGEGNAVDEPAFEEDLRQRLDNLRGKTKDSKK